MTPFLLDRGHGPQLDGYAFRPLGPAGLAHLQRSDIVIRVGKSNVENVESLRKALDTALATKSSALIPIIVIRGSENRVLYLDPYWLSN